MMMMESPWSDENTHNNSNFVVNNTGKGLLAIFAATPNSVMAGISDDELENSNMSDGGVAIIPRILGNRTTSAEVTNDTNPYYQGHDDLYEPPAHVIVLLSLLYGGISVAALIGNMLVLWVVTVSRRMRTVTNMFIANLALADIIIGLFAIPFQFQAALLQRWNLPDFMCAFCPFVQVLSVNVSVFTLSAIAMDRYRAVLYPLSARVSKRKATWAIMSIWSLGLLLALPTELDYKVVYIMEKGKEKPFCTNLGLSSTFRTYYNLSLVVIQYFFPLITISGAYAHMATKLWGSTAPGNKEESRDAVVLKNKKKVIKMLALVVLLFGVCWLPLQMYNFLQTLILSINQYQYINIIWFCSHWLAMSNSCCNPFIYAIYNDKFQREFRARLHCFRFCAREWDDSICSDASDFDRSKVRASYRFTNNRSVRHNGQDNLNCRNMAEFQRTGSAGSNRGGSVHHHHRRCKHRRSRGTSQQQQYELDEHTLTCGATTNGRLSVPVDNRALVTTDFGSGGTESCASGCRTPNTPIRNNNMQTVLAVATDKGVTVRCGYTNCGIVSEL